MNDEYDRLSAARQDLELVCADLIRVSAQLEELATAWRRDHVAGITTRELPLTFPASLQAATLRLVATLRTLVDDGPDQPPGLAFPPSPSWPPCMPMSQPPPMTASGKRPARRLTVPPALASGPASSTP